MICAIPSWRRPDREKGTLIEGVPVLRNVSLEVARSKTVAVVGESGGSKSTLARVVTGLLPPGAGRIVFDGEVMPANFGGRNKEMRRRLQMIHQMPDAALNPRQKLFEIPGRPLEFYFSMRRAKKPSRINELLEQIELPEHYASRYPSELSGGGKRRIAIARALAAEPDLIICDEVTSALDQLVVAEILKLL